MTLPCGRVGFFSTKGIKEKSVMKEMYIKDLEHTPEGTQVVLLYWLKAKRNLGGLLFADICDSTGSIQIVAMRNEEVQPSYLLSLSNWLCKRYRKSASKPSFASRARRTSACDCT